jgi:uncharacterized protein (TIGR02001 family)
LVGAKRYTLALATPVLSLALGLAQPARAQVSAALGLQSDYRYRGISLSSGRPSATLDLSFDHKSGFYAGGSAIVTNQADGLKSLGFIEYLGYATPRFGGVSWDLGVNNQDLAYYYGDRRVPLRYSEVYVGVAGDSLSAHLHYSPNYLRPGYGALYAEVDGSFKPAENWRLFGHIGTTVPVGETEGRHERWDARAGVARQLGPFEFQASVVATTPNPPGLTPQGRTTLVVGASWFF